MGRWMEVHPRLLCPHEADYDARRANIVDETAPHPLIWAGETLLKQALPNFQMLKDLSLASPNYVDEKQWLSPQAAKQAADELTEFVDLCSTESAALRQQWCNEHTWQEMTDWSTLIINMLKCASANGHYVLILL